MRFWQNPLSPWNSPSILFTILTKLCWSSFSMSIPDNLSSDSFWVDCSVSFDSACCWLVVVMLCCRHWYIVTFDSGMSVVSPVVHKNIKFVWGSALFFQLSRLRWDIYVYEYLVGFGASMNTSFFQRKIMGNKVAKLRSSVPEVGSYWSLAEAEGK